MGYHYDVFVLSVICLLSVFIHIQSYVHVMMDSWNVHSCVEIETVLVYDHYIDIPLVFWIRHDVFVLFNIWLINVLLVFKHIRSFVMMDPWNAHTRSRRYFREEVFPRCFLFMCQFHALVFHRMKSSSTKTLGTSIYSMVHKITKNSKPLCCNDACKQMVQTTNSRGWG